MSLFVDNPYEAYPTQDSVWKRFEGIFQALNGIVFYAPMFKAYFREALHEFYKDNVQYTEIRALLPDVSPSKAPCTPNCLSRFFPDFITFPQFLRPPKMPETLNRNWKEIITF